jgi:hypothetical protein
MMTHRKKPLLELIKIVLYSFYWKPYFLSVVGTR